MTQTPDSGSSLSYLNPGFHARSPPHMWQQRVTSGRLLLLGSFCSVLFFDFTEVLVNVNLIALFILDGGAADSGSQCLATAHVREEVCDLAVGLQPLDELVRVHAVGLSGEQDVVGKLLLGNFRLFLFCYGCLLYTSPSPRD